MRDVRVEIIACDSRTASEIADALFRLLKNNGVAYTASALTGLQRPKPGFSLADVRDELSVSIVVHN